MMSNFQKVKEFHEKFECLINEVPTIPDEKTNELRIKILGEEFTELLQEFGYSVGIIPPNYSSNLDLEKIAKELCDLLYVTYGTAVSFGIDIDACFDEVHKSNLSKLDENGKVVKRDDGKVIKSSLYRPPNLTKILSP